METLYGKYVNGSGVASKWLISKKAGAVWWRSLHGQLFGDVLYGSFNIQVRGNPREVPPTITEGVVHFNFTKITNDKGEEAYGWWYRWDGSRQSKTIVEIYSRDLLPETFKNGQLKVEFLKKGSEAEAQWRKNKKKPKS